MLKLKDRYFIKIVPQRGDTVHRFEVTRRHILTAAAALGLLVLSILTISTVQTIRAHAQLAALVSLTLKQREQIQSIDRKTAAIRSQLQHVQKQNVEIQQLIGVHPAAPKRLQKTSWVSSSKRAPIVVATRRIDLLAADSAQTVHESNLLRRLTMHVLNVRHLQELQRAQLLAEIPSIDPVNGATVVGCFCYRSYPDVEFHEGVDLGADYGQRVHAAAAGTIASAGWDGGYGMKIDIDHGNGYHTWYAHLSQIDVKPGEYVHKGQVIGLVGSTGFSTGPHLHYQVMLNGTPVDPDPYLHGVPAKVLASLP